MAAAFLFAVCAAVSVNAQNRTPRISHKQYNQHCRIQQGVHSGQLTRREATSLRMQQARIAGMKRMAKADGVVTHRERKMINRAQHNSSVAIYHKKHNGMYR